MNYDLSVGLLFQPLVITATLSLMAVLLVRLEPLVTLPPVFEEPGAAQATLGVMAAALMTVISVVYSVLIMAMTLASTQFSPRVLTNFLRGGACQTTLGLFLGTFSYCVLVLRTIKTQPAPFVPQLALWGAVVLSLACLLWLVFFVHHMAQSIQVNYIVDRIAHETERVIDDELPLVLARDEEAAAEPTEPRGREGGVEIESTVSGYVQLVDPIQLEQVARARGLVLFVHRGVGDFLAQGSLLATAFPVDASGGGRAHVDDLQEACRVAFDVGPLRTMQQDLEFGFRQIVDVALKAISPAVNDPSTAATCTAHLGRLMIRASRRARHPQAVEGPVHFLRRPTFLSLLDLAFTQIRQYSHGDMAVSLSLVRSLGDIARASACSSYRQAALEHMRLVMSTRTMPVEDMVLLRSRVLDLEEPVLASISPDKTAAPGASAAPAEFDPPDGELHATVRVVVEQEEDRGA